MSFFYRRREGEYSLDAFSTTPPVSEGSAVLCPLLHGFTLTVVRASPAVTHGAPPPEAVLCVDMDVDAEEVLWVMSAYCLYLYLCSLFLLSFNIFALFKSFFIFADV